MSNFYGEYQLIQLDLMEIKKARHLFEVEMN
jgi:hypothetical protein